MIRRIFRGFQSQGEFASVLRGGAQVAIIRLLGAALAFSSQVALTRWLGAHDMGIYVSVLAWINILAVLACCGLQTSSLRLIPEYLTLKSFDRLKGFLKFSLVGTILMSVIVAMLSMAGVHWIIGEQSEYQTPLLYGALILPLLSLSTLLSEQLRSFRAVAQAYIPTLIMRPTILLGLVFLLGMQNQDLAVEVALNLTLVSFLVVVGILSLLILSRLKNIVGDRIVESQFEIGEWSRISLPLLLVSGSIIMINQIDVLMISSLMTPKSVAVYNAAAKISALVGFGLVVMNARVSSSISSLYVEGKRQELEMLIKRVSLWTSAIAVLVGFVVLASGRLLLGVFGDGFDIGYLTLVILIVTHFANSLSGPVGLILTMTGNHVTTAKIFAFVVVSNILLNILLIPRFGIEGAATASLLSVIARNVLCWVYVSTRVHIKPPVVAWASKLLGNSGN